MSWLLHFIKGEVKLSLYCSLNIWHSVKSDKRFVSVHDSLNISDWLWCLKKTISELCVRLQVPTVWRRRCLNSVCTVTSSSSRSKPSNHSTLTTQRPRPLQRYHILQHQNNSVTFFCIFTTADSFFLRMIKTQLRVY